MTRTRTMFLFTALVLLVVSRTGSTEDRTYERTDPVTGQTVACQRCPPGYRLRAHCTSSCPTQCVPCDAGLYTEFWNYIPNCLMCDACAELQRVARPCNGKANTVCECEGGFFWDQHFCRRHGTCQPGHGVKTPGSVHRDTVCELCPDRQFADITKTHAACVSHSACVTDEQLVLPGSKWHDNVCATCDDITARGWLDLFRPIVSGLFFQQRIPSQRLQRFIRQRVRSQRRTADGPAEQVQHWISQASAEELLKLPDMLEKSHLDQLAHKIRQKIRKFQTFADCCSNSLNKTRLYKTLTCLTTVAQTHSHC